MVDPVSPVGSALQATLTGDLLQTLESALASGSVTSSPPSIQNSTTPLAISGTLVSQLQNGGAVVQTAAGPVALALPNNTPPLPQGTLTLLIQPGNPPTASIINQQPVTPQAQVQTQATAAQQTQDVQTQPLQALPPITVGQVLTATPLPQATTATIVQPAPIDTDPVPVVSQALSGAAVSAAIAVELPIAVMLNSAIPPAPSAPTTNFVTAQPFVVDAVEATPEEEAVSSQTGQPQTQSAPPQSQNASLGALPAEIDTDLDGDQEVSAPINFLAAQESASNAPQEPNIAAQMAYNPGVVLSPQSLSSQPVYSSNAPAPQPQEYLVLKVAQPLADGVVSPPAPAGAMTATVVAQTSSGQPLLETSDGSALLVSQKVSSPVGTELTLQRVAQDQATPQTSSGAQTQAQAPLTPLNDVPLSIARQQSWPALTQLMTMLGGASPLAASYIRQAIPSLGDGFAQAFTAFLSRGLTPTTSFPAAPGTLTIPLTLLPGQAAAAHTADPQQLRTTLLQIGTDLTTSAAKASPAQPWQSLQVPVLTDYGINMAQLFIRQQIEPVDDEPGKRATANSTRFLVEISPSQLGPVQLDGLLRKTQTNTDRLDLIVRTEFAVPPSAADEMAGMFQNTLGATGMVGTLGFQVGPENFVLPASDDNTLYRGTGERSI